MARVSPLVVFSLLAPRAASSTCAAPRQGQRWQQYAQLTWRLLHGRRVEVPGALRERFHLQGMDVHAGDKLGHEAVLAQGFEFGLPCLDRRPAVEHVYFRLLPQRVPWSLAAVSRRAMRFCESSSAPSISHRLSSPLLYPGPFPYLYKLVRCICAPAGTRTPC